MDSPQSALVVRDLSLYLPTPSGPAQILDRVSFDLSPGEILGVVGESGSGKSMTAFSILGLLPPGAQVDATAVDFDGVDLTSLSPRELRSLRGRRIAMVFQDHMTTLDPVARIGRQIEEAYLIHHPRAKRAEATERAVRALEQVGVPNAAERMQQYPHQWSGGMRQRAVIAMALVNDPDVVIADEPTTALDVTVQAEVLALLRRLQRSRALSILLITHDMGVIAEMADRVVVMKDGQVVETGEVHELFANPKNDYTRKLLDAVPRPHTEVSEPVDETRVDDHEEPALEVENLSVRYPGSWRKPGFLAVDDVSFSVASGQIVGLVGESGSGKSTIGKAIIGLAPVTAGSIRASGQSVVGLPRKHLRAASARYGMVFQDPSSSLNPRMVIGASIAEPLVVHRPDLSMRERRSRVAEVLEQVELPSSWLGRFPHELSGGQRQRVGIARALALNPSLLIADEPTSALDVSVQAAVLEVFQELQQKLGFSCLFISHDLAVVQLLSEHVVVLREGSIVEQGHAQRVLTRPQKEYTQRLVAAAPLPDPALQRARWTENT